MAKSGRHEQLLAIFGAQLHRNVLAQRRRTHPQIDCDVEDAANGAANKLELGLRRALVVNSAQHTAGRAAMVILHKVDVQAQGGEPILSIALVEEAPRVAKSARLEDDDALERGSSQGD